MRETFIQQRLSILPRKFGNDVEIGPFSLIGPEAAIGDKTIVQSNVVIEGSVTIGAGNRIGHGAIIGAPPQDLLFSPERKTSVEIGNENVIREYCTIHRGSPEGSATKIGDKNFLMAGAHVGHNCEIGNNVIIANNCLLAGHVRVDDGAFLGGGCLSTSTCTWGGWSSHKADPPSAKTFRRLSSRRNAIASSA